MLTMLTLPTRSARTLPGRLLVLGVLLILGGCAGSPPSDCGPDCHAEQRRDAYLAAHPELSPKITAAIAEGRVLMGMTANDVVAVLGEPDRKVDAHAPWIEREQWIYRSEEGVPVYYVFRFGRLHTWTGDPTASNE